jgi:hypothetical protein
MNTRMPHHGLASDERGFVLIFALLVLVTLTFLGFMAINTAVNENTVSGNERVQRQSFSVADGGTEVAVHMLQENMDCPTGFPDPLPATEGKAALRFLPSPAFAATTNGKDYTATLPADVRARLVIPANGNHDGFYDIPPRPEIFRQLCVGGTGDNFNGNNGCVPGAADAGAPHTNILYNPDPDGAGSTHAAGENANANGGAIGQGFNIGAGGATKDVQIISQHVAYRPDAANPVTTRESIVQMTWAQPNNNVNNCRW